MTTTTNETKKRLNDRVESTPIPIQHSFDIWWHDAASSAGDLPAYEELICRVAFAAGFAAAASRIETAKASAAVLVYRDTAPDERFQMPVPSGRCPICGIDHAADEAHNPFSIFYQVRFSAAHGRGATWEDAVAHLPEEKRREWREEVHLVNAPWTSPPAGQQPISEPVTP